MTQLRGTTEGADCESCPYSINGRPHKPVTAEFPEQPLWILVGEGPGRTEVQVNRPFQSGQDVINKMLFKIGRRRDELALVTAVLCASPAGKPVEADRDRAVSACSGRLKAELAQWPGKPILTLGAVAARAIIPKATLEAIDPPNVPKTKKHSQKERQKAEAKAASKEAKRYARGLAKVAERRFAAKRKARITQIYDEMMRPHPSTPYQKRNKPKHDLVLRTLALDEPQLKRLADAEAIVEYDVAEKLQAMQATFIAANPKPPKPRKPKAVKITDIMSTCFEVDIDGSGPRAIIPTIHPMSLLRGGGATIGGTHTPDLAFINLIYDAQKINSLAQGKDVRLKLDIETETTDPVRTGELLIDIIFQAIAEGECALDLETYVDDPEKHHALMTYRAKIRTIGLATEDRAVSIMWDLIPSWGYSLIQLLLAHPTVTKTFHNGIYDRSVLIANGYTFAGPWECTLLAHHAAFPGNSHRLQSVTSQLFAISPWKSEFRNSEETPEGLTIYNAKDTGATRAVRPALTVMVKRTKTERIYALDRKMAEVASRMHLAGMPVSREINTELLNTFSTNVKDSKRAVEAIAEDPKLRENIWNHLALQQAVKARKADPQSYVKPDGEIVHDLEARFHVRRNELAYDKKWRWKISASKHITALLQALSIPLLQVTASGQISTKKDVLESLAHHPIVRDILTFRENDKLLSTFIYRIFNRFNSAGELIQHGYADEEDRIHPIWSTHKITGRWASSEPVVSNVPKDKWRKGPNGEKIVTRPNLRRQIRAPKGRIFVGFDFSQLEARIIALISGDPFLCEVFAAGLDIHRECAKVIFPKFETLGASEQKQLRDLTKPLEYGAFYGGSVETLWRNLVKEGRSVRLADIAKAVATLMHKMEGVVRWQRNAVATAMTPPYEVRDFLLGRRRTFPLGQVEATEAMNFGVQAAGSAIMNTGMGRMADLIDNFKECEPIGQFHDAAIFECWADDADLVAAAVKDSFTQSYERDGRVIPFPIDLKIGVSWADV